MKKDASQIEKLEHQLENYSDDDLRKILDARRAARSVALLKRAHDSAKRVEQALKSFAETSWSLMDALEVKHHSSSCRDDSRDGAWGSTSPTFKACPRCYLLSVIYGEQEFEAHLRLRLIVDTDPDVVEAMKQ